MPLFFFDIAIDDDFRPDDTGVDYDTPADARQAAIGTMGELARDHFVTSSGGTTIVITIRDASGQAISNAEAWLKVT